MPTSEKNPSIFCAAATIATKKLRLPSAAHCRRLAARNGPKSGPRLKQNLAVSSISSATARLAARWINFGGIHGVGIWRRPLRVPSKQPLYLHYRPRPNLLRNHAHQAGAERKLKSERPKTFMNALLFEQSNRRFTELDAVLRRFSHGHVLPHMCWLARRTPIQPVLSFCVQAY
jgi:hypothetical protein